VTSHALAELWSHWADLETDEAAREELTDELATEAFRDAAHLWFWLRLKENGND
jgi:hypothetical protein